MTQTEFLLSTWAMLWNDKDQFAQYQEERVGQQQMGSAKSKISSATSHIRIAVTVDGGCEVNSASTELDWGDRDLVWEQHVVRLPEGYDKAQITGRAVFTVQSRAKAEAKAKAKELKAQYVQRKKDFEEREQRKPTAADMDESMRGIFDSYKEQYATYQSLASAMEAYEVTKTVRFIIPREAAIEANATGTSSAEPIIIGDSNGAAEFRDQILATIRSDMETKLAALKSFVGQVCRKLPRPQRVDVARKWRGTRTVLKLVYVCPRTGMELEVESSEWSLWLKFAWSIVQTGNALLVQQDIVGAIDSAMAMVEGAYAAYHEVDSAQATLEAMKREPILLPSEEEKLIQGLRDAKFFEIFDYDDQNAEWLAVAELSAATATGSGD